MSKIITICSTKGGVGKTTLTANLGGFLASLGKRVLLVDADVQPSLTRYFEHTYSAPAGLVNLLLDKNIINTISQTNSGCDLIRSDDTDSRLPIELAKSDFRLNLKESLSDLSPQYDFILVDTQGAKGPVQDAAIIAADILLSPIPVEALSAREFLDATLGMIASNRPSSRFSSYSIAPLYGLIYRADHTRDAALNTELLTEAISIMADKYQVDMTLLDAKIYASVAWREAASLGVAIHTLKKHPLAKLSLMAVIAELGLLPQEAAEKGGVSHD